jgi:alpha-tubulin suppressor-like RCC1 family protein
MAINFPDSPSLNDIFTDETSGFTYQWDGEVWKSYVDPTIGNVTKLDDISGSFNGITSSFALTVNSSPATADLDPAKIILSLGGVVQNPVQDYTISGTTLTFTTAPAVGLSFFASFYETGINKNYISSNTISPSNLTTGGFSWNTGGDLYISGVSTVSNTGTATTALYVSGNARVAGILTVGSSSITIDGTNNRITGTGITISSGGIVGVAITATSYFGDGVNLVGAGIGTQTSINTSGIITASKFSGDATYITDVGGILDAIVYSPGVGVTNVSLTSNIILTFNKPIKANTGTITLRTGSASGTIVESYDITSSSNLTISGAKLTIDPTSSLSGFTTYFVVVPAGTVKDLYNTGSSAVIDDYSFITTQPNFQLFAWASNNAGQLGQNSTTYYSSPIQIPGTQWNQISAGDGQASYGIKSDNTLWSWGYNQYGDLGQNNKTNYSSPIQIPGTQWSYIEGGANHALATKTDGTLWVWGANINGRLGQNSLNDHKSSPVQVPGTQWKTVRGGVSGGSFQSLAIKTDGTLWAWGRNQQGNLGQNNIVDASSPVQIPGTQWSYADSGLQQSFALKTDGTLWVWGYNHRGQIGDNSTINKSSPTQLPGTSWNSVSCAYLQGYAIKTDGTLWSWGFNYGGGLGLNQPGGFATDVSSPTQIPGTQWKGVDGGLYRFLATKTDNTLWAAGRSYGGNNGQNNAIDYSSPIQVPGTQWSSVSNGNNQSLAIKQT